MRLFRDISATLFAATLAGLAIPAAAADSAPFDTPYMPYQAFDTLPATEVNVGGGTVVIAYAPGAAAALAKSEIAASVERCAKTVAQYYGRFPVSKYRLLIMPVAGSGIRGGTTFGYRGAATKLRFGVDSSLVQLNNDWVLIHEMIHTAFPSMDDRHHWIEEGIATYVESIARVQVGNLDEAAMWLSLVKGMPNGLPGIGDAGLDNTHSWGRTYWGGAIFCLVADVRIRERTGNRFGLQDALRAIVQAGGNITQEDWSMDKVLKAGDAATGVHVLQELYAQTGNAAVDPDLPALWRKLGVTVPDKSVVLDDKAPEAGVRKAIVGVH